MITIYIIRHGQTDSNVRNTYLGHTDIPLNDVGIQQAKEASEKLKNIKFDAIYSSPLIRAMQTAQIITKPHKDIPITMSYGVKERDYGLFDDLTIDEIIDKYPNEHSGWLNNWIEYKIPNGESAIDVHNRSSKTLDKIIQTYPDATVGIVSHLGTTRHMIAYLLGLSVKDSWHFALDNCRCAVIKYENRHGILTALNL